MWCHNSRAKTYPAGQPESLAKARSPGKSGYPGYGLIRYGLGHQLFCDCRIVHPDGYPGYPEEGDLKKSNTISPLHPRTPLPEFNPPCQYVHGFFKNGNLLQMHSQLLIIRKDYDHHWIQTGGFPDDKNIESCV